MSGRDRDGRQSYPHRVGRLECMIDLFLRDLISRDDLERQYERYSAGVADQTDQAEQRVTS